MRVCQRAARASALVLSYSYNYTRPVPESLGGHAQPAHTENCTQPAHAVVWHTLVACASAHMGRTVRRPQTAGRLQGTRATTPTSKPKTLPAAMPPPLPTCCSHCRPTRCASMPAASSSRGRHVGIQRLRGRTRRRWRRLLLSQHASLRLCARLGKQGRKVSWLCTTADCSVHAGNMPPAYLKSLSMQSSQLQLHRHLLLERLHSTTSVQ